MGDFSLTDEERAFFLENGYFGPFETYTPDEARKLWAKIVSAMLTEKSKVYDPNEFHYDRHLDIDTLTDHVTHPTIIDKVISIVGPDVLLWRTEVFSKLPGSSGTEWHQVHDFSYANNKVPQLVPDGSTDWGVVLTAWTAWSECTIENGCLKLMPGSHKEMAFDETKDFTKPVDYESTSLYGYTFADLKKDPNWEPDESKAVSMVMEPGQTVLFTSRTLHGSHPNTSKKSRRYSTNMRYVKASAQVFPEMETVTDHGQVFDLSNYKPVLVAGSDQAQRRETTRVNLNGHPFRYRG